MNDTIVKLKPVEDVTFDHATLAALCTDEGLRAEATITEALDRIEGLVQLVGAQEDHRQGLIRSCTDLQAVAGKIGMMTIRDTAAAVVDCTRRGDGAAVAACVARLKRLGTPGSTGGWHMDNAPQPVA
ncbi:hypothetical protein [Jannaschia marina]|uniref:hypothetical protein n=1 Tax=Jannaschia marina TaxID=2741674 RepID=UPI0015CAA0FF|nr:hypothetical protein [Jannaschia marina]